MYPLLAEDEKTEDQRLNDFPIITQTWYPNTNSLTLNVLPSSAYYLISTVSS